MCGRGKANGEIIVLNGNMRHRCPLLRPAHGDGQANGDVVALILGSYKPPLGYTDLDVGVEANF